MKEKELEFGKTPWDELEVVDLQMCLLAMSVALQSIAYPMLSEVMSMAIARGSDIPFWGKNGTGGKTFSKVAQAQQQAQAVSVQLDRNQLLRLVCTTFDALDAARSLFFQTNMQREFVLLDKLLGEMSCGFSAGRIYYSFFRYAANLLFDSSEFNIGHGWVVCDKCGEITADDRDLVLLGGSCPVTVDGSRCDGTLRAYTWTDLGRPEFGL
ncbi:MAG: hypothetical protein ABIH21_04470 [Patescibacteria group bacterium]